MKKTLLPLIPLLLLFSCAGNKEGSIELQSTDDLAGLRVATLAGSYYDMNLSPRDDISLQLYNADSDILQALLNNKADVAVDDEVVFNAEIRKEYNVKIALRGKESFPTAFLFSKSNPELSSACTAVQRRMEEDGTMQRLKDFWLTDRYAQEKQFTHIPEESSGEPLRVATATANAPISFQVNGEWYGLEIDILRELAKELNDYYISPGAEDRAMIEAAHVAVTAIRTMQMLSKERRS